jgi:hypothetical protein
MQLLVALLSACTYPVFTFLPTCQYFKQMNKQRRISSPTTSPNTSAITSPTTSPPTSPTECAPKFCAPILSPVTPTSTPPDFDLDVQNILFVWKVTVPPQKIQLKNSPICITKPICIHHIVGRSYNKENAYSQISKKFNLFPSDSTFTYIGSFDPNYTNFSKNNQIVKQWLNHHIGDILTFYTRIDPWILYFSWIPIKLSL